MSTAAPNTPAVRENSCRFGQIRRGMHFAFEAGGPVFSRGGSCWARRLSLGGYGSSVVVNVKDPVIPVLEWEWAHSGDSAHAIEKAAPDRLS